MITTDQYGVERDTRYPDATFGRPYPTLYPDITIQTVTVNQRSGWGSKLVCGRCGSEQVSLVGSSVSYEDGPSHFARGHDCLETVTA